MVGAYSPSAPSVHHWNQLVANSPIPTLVGRSILNTPLMNKQPRGRRLGVTLVELLVVIAVIAILAAILLVAVGKVKASAHESKCVANLRSIGAAASLYSADNDMRTVPPAIRLLSPYLENAYSIFVCPSDDRTKSESYILGASVGYSDMSYAYNGVRIGLPPTYWENSPATVFQITDPSNTIYFADAKLYFMNRHRANQNAVGRHDGAANTLMFDGSVQSRSLATEEDRIDFYSDL